MSDRWQRISLIQYAINNQFHQSIAELQIDGFFVVPANIQVKSLIPAVMLM
jgi:hypothetical protein